MNQYLHELDTLPVDFVMSVGPACRPAQQIKHAGLRFTAAPMDWMQLYPLGAVTHIFETGFTDFFAEIEDITPEPGKKNRRVVDTKNDICSIHHFPSKDSLEKAQKDVRKTMHKRYKRIHGILRKAERICFVCNREDAPEALLAFLRDFGSIYPHADMVMVNMRHTDTDGIAMEKYTEDRCTVYEARFRDENPKGTDIAQNPDTWHGNTPRWQQVLKHVHLSEKTQKRADSKLRKLLGLN